MTNIELFGPGDTNPQGIQRLDLKLILCAAEIQIDKEAEAALDFSAWNQDMEEVDTYEEILDCLEGRVTDIKIAVRLRNECRRLSKWVDLFCNLPGEGEQ